MDCFTEIAKRMDSKPDPPVLPDSTLSAELTITLLANLIFNENHDA